jgi:hypothetical protein
MPPLRLINTAHSQLGAFSISYPACWEARCYPGTAAHISMNRAEDESSRCVVYISALRHQLSMRVPALAEPRDPQVLAFLAWAIGFDPGRCRIAETSLAGVPATQMTGPARVGYASVIVAWGQDGNVLLLDLIAPTRDAFNRVAPMWRRMTRTVKWDQAKSRQYAKFHQYCVLHIDAE